MNAEAARLGLDNTHFANATGLPNRDHYSTARDLAHLAAALRRDFPEYRDYFALRAFSWGGVTQPNRNPLLGRVPGVDGLKTGHTEAAGYCLVASAEREPMQLIAAVLGIDRETDRLKDGRTLLEYGFREFETRALYAGGQRLATVPVWMGADDRVAVGLPQELWLTLPRGGFDGSRARRSCRRRSRRRWQAPPASASCA
jgi:D-alanyl-D-alanine carboxypeptidase (penicillin-binding protein 5/6)